MKLTADAVKPYITGCMALPTEADGAILLQRFLEDQREGHEDDRAIRMRTYTAAGATVDLHTDSDIFRLTVDGRRLKSMAFAVADLFVDGVLVAQEKIPFGAPCAGPMEYVPFDPYTIELSLPEGEHRVTVVFESETPYRVVSLELSDGASHRVHDYKYTWMAFGDSITYGCTPEVPSASYALSTARLLDAKLYNHGIGGEEYRDTKVIPGTYPACDFVTVAYGTNDYVSYTLEQHLHHMGTFLKKISESFPEKPVFVLLPLWRKKQTVLHHDITLPQVRDAIRAEAAKYPNFHVIDCQNFVPPMRDFFCEDICVHPNVLGASLYAQNLHKIITEVLL